MLLTDKVTIEWLASQNMTKGNKFGVPVDVENLSLGLKWKSLEEMIEPDDFDTIDKYYELKALSK